MNAGESPRQLPLELGHAAQLGRDDLVVSDANRDAVTLVDGWPDWPSATVLMAGPPGSGKSHLGEIWSAAADALRVAPDNIRGALGDCEGRPVFIDGIEPGNFDETALFHLLNLLRQTGGSLLLTSRRFPAAWGIGLPDLLSRLKAVTLVEIREPDDALLSGVLAKLFSDRQVDVDPVVLRYLVTRMERSLATAGDLVDRLDRRAMEQKSRISRALAAEILTAHDRGQGELDM